MRVRGVEVLLADGGSTDGTQELAVGMVDRVIVSPAGRARQMNHGARQASGRVLWFLHADTLVPEDVDLEIMRLVAAGHPWGYFKVRLSGSRPILAVVARMMNLRSGISGIATGDQGLFMTRQAYRAVAGFEPIPLMEDVHVCRRLRELAPPACARWRLVTSSRRWQRDGVMRTIGMMWWLRWLDWLGVSPARLARLYATLGS